MTRGRPALRRRARLWILVPIVALGSISQPGPSLEAQVDDLIPPDSFNVLEYGATGDGVTNDTAAIQRADDAAAAQGGGVVFFPPGIYLASGVRQDSFVEFRGTVGAVLKHPVGGWSEPIIRSRLRSALGSVAAGSTVVDVRDSTGFTEGSLVAVRGAGGGSTTQLASVAQAIDAAATEVVLGNTFGFSTGSTYRPNYLLIGNEIVTYQTIADRKMTGLTRGLFGTAAEPHPAYTPVKQLLVHYSRLASLTRTSLTLEDPAPFAVTDVLVYGGVRGASIRQLEFDGNRQDDGPASLFSVLYELADASQLSGNTFHSANSGAIRLDRGTSNVTISENSFTDNGGAGDDGAAVWLFRGARSNAVRDNDVMANTSNGIFVDDRTDASTEWDRGSNGNVIEGNVIDIPSSTGNSAVGIFGSSDNLVYGNALRRAWHGVRIFTTLQSRVKVETARNVVEGNSMNGHTVGVWADGSQNSASANTMNGVATPYVDAGTDNHLGP